MDHELSEKIIDAACEVHRHLGGPGLLENIHLRLTGKKLGLLINFGKENLKEGICQVLNDC